MEQKGKEADSPAFHLRPRRNTPSKLGAHFSPASRRRYSSVSDLHRYGTKRVISFEEQKSNVTPLAPYSTAQAEETDEQNMQRLLREARESACNPSRLLMENVDLGVFAERISLEQMPLQQNPGNKYICVRVVHVCPPMQCNVTPSQQLPTSDGCSPITTENRLSDKRSCVDDSPDSERRRCSPRQAAAKAKVTEVKTTTVKRQGPLNLTGSTPSPLKLYVQNARSLEEAPLVDVDCPLWVLYLHSPYALPTERCPSGQLLEIIHFELEKMNDVSTETFKYLGSPMRFASHSIQVKLSVESVLQVPVVSLKSELFEPDNTQLVVLNFSEIHKEQAEAEARGDSSKSNTMFSSYVVKSDLVDEKSCLHQTKSPTIKRFMKTISSVSMDRTRIKIKLKRDL